MTKEQQKGYFSESKELTHMSYNNNFKAIAEPVVRVDNHQTNLKTQYSKLKRFYKSLNHKVHQN